MAMTAEDITMQPLTGNIGKLPVQASTKIYEGALVGVSAAGYAENLDGADATISAAFAGIAKATADNSSGSDGDIEVEFYRGVQFVVVSLAAAQANVGDVLYASDENTFSLTDDATTIAVGKVAAYLSATEIIAKLEPTV